MNIVSVDEMKKIFGGSITASFLAAFVRGVNSFLDVGRSIGSSVRRLYEGKFCSL